ncbi:unnamed protein product [Rhizoctonia solani]|uniref:BTB domain-containing protein n=1 Tax=Rhizoctonia solani TaxID=456999 RepID=A0A8H3C0E2_9AGAM|nr:unnamed protein product [Rhizoctonia solani]
MTTELTVIVRGKTFLLSKDQIEFEKPNLFTDFVLKHPEVPRPPIQLTRDPRLFSLIVDHLCGYTILPLHDTDIPGMTQERALLNLKEDAKYYRLGKLMELIEKPSQSSSTNPQGLTKDLPLKARMTPFFHFPGRITSLFNYWDGSPSAFVEFPFPIDLRKSFTVALWFRAKSKDGRQTVLSLDVPSEPNELLQITFGADTLVRLEIGVGNDSGNASADSSDDSSGRLTLGTSDTAAPLNVWTHMALIQHIDKAGGVDRRILYLDGKDWISSTDKTHIYSPTPSQTRMALMRGCRDRMRTSAFNGQIEDVTLFQRVIDQDELSDRASKMNKPSEHGGPTEAGSEDWDFDSIY